MMENNGAVGAIIVAAGKGSRMGLGYNKVLAPLCGKPVIQRTIEAFAASGLVDFLVLVISPEDEPYMKRLCGTCTSKMPIAMAYGGKERQDSVFNGIKALDESVGVVLIHDGARPFPDKALIERSIENAKKYGAACAGMPVKDTIKIVNEEGKIVATPDRKRVWIAQTPQAFLKPVIQKAYETALEKGISSTDDAGLAEAAGFEVVMFEGSYGNIKLTSSEDLLMAERLLDSLDKAE